MSYTWVEPFAGAAAVALRLVGGSDLTPPVAWMGGKRRYARVIADAMGVPEGRPVRVVLCDAGPWGWVWPLLLDPEKAKSVCEWLRSWADEHPRALWERLAAVPPSKHLDYRAAQWLWLQARSASGVPIWREGWRAVQADHATGRLQGATQTGGDQHWVDARRRGITDRGEDLRWPGRAQRRRWEQGARR